MSAETRDSIFLRDAGAVIINQPRRGHRFTIDSVLLADFCRIKRADRILEPGAGTGIVSILLAKKFPSASFTAVEVQPELAHLCRRNVSENDLTGRIWVIQADITDLGSAGLRGRFDAIVANPPYTRAGAGRRSPLHERRAARQDMAGSIEVWLDLSRFLKNGGRYFLVFPASRLGELVGLMRERRLEPKRLCLVHPYLERPASLVLVEAVKSAGVGLEVLPPLILHEGAGYSDELRRIYGL